MKTKDGLWGNEVKIPKENLLECPNKNRGIKKCLGHMLVGDVYCRECYLRKVFSAKKEEPNVQKKVDNFFKRRRFLNN